MASADGLKRRVLDLFKSHLDHLSLEAKSESAGRLERPAGGQALF